MQFGPVPPRDGQLHLRGRWLLRRLLRDSPQRHIRTLPITPDASGVVRELEYIYIYILPQLCRADNVEERTRELEHVRRDARSKAARPKAACSVDLDYDA